MTNIYSRSLPHKKYICVALLSMFFFRFFIGILLSYEVRSYRFNSSANTLASATIYIDGLQSNI